MKFNKETKVGILVLISGVILYIGFNFLKGNNVFSSSNKFNILYDNVEGLTVSNSVIINGFTVGRVEEIKILHDKSDSLLVKIDINKDVILLKGTTAKLASPDLLGGKIIELIQGDQLELVESGDYLIGVKEKGLATVLEEKATPVLNTLDTAITNLSGYFDDDVSSSIRNIINNLDQMSKYGALSMKQVNYILASNAKGINETNKNIENLTLKIDTLLSSSNTLVNDKVGALVDSLRNLEIHKIITSTSKTADQLEHMISKVDSGGGTLGKMIYDPVLYNNLNTAVEDLDFLLVDFQANPQRYINVSVFGGKVKEKSIIKKTKPSLFEDELRIEFNDNYVPSDIDIVFYSMDHKIKTQPIKQHVDKDVLILTLDSTIPSGEYIVKLVWNKGKNEELVKVNKK